MLHYLLLIRRIAFIPPFVLSYFLRYPEQRVFLFSALRQGSKSEVVTVYLSTIMITAEIFQHFVFICVQF